MHTLWKRFALTCGITLALAGIAAAQEVTGSTPQVPAGWAFTFPDGNAKDGHTTFMRMECYSCHVLKGVKDQVPADSGNIGPDLTGSQSLPKEYLAESIIKAHTVVATPGYTVTEGKAGMGNYNHFMTIQELIDIVAFLRHGPAEHGPAGQGAGGNVQ